MNCIQKVTPLDDYILLLEFTDGAVREYDMKPFLDSPVYRPLQNKALFNQAKIVYDYTVGWNDEIDICPDCAYRDSMPTSLEYSRPYRPAHGTDSAGLHS